MGWLGNEKFRTARHCLNSQQITWKALWEHSFPLYVFHFTFFHLINIITNETVSLALAVLESAEDSSKLFIHLQFLPTRGKLFYWKALTCCYTLNWLGAIKVSISFIQLRRETCLELFLVSIIFPHHIKVGKSEFGFEVKIFTIRFPHFSFFPHSEPGRQRANIFPSSEQIVFKSIKIQDGENVSAFPRIFIYGRATFLCVCYTFLSPF